MDTVTISLEKYDTLKESETILKAIVSYSDRCKSYNTDLIEFIHSVYPANERKDKNDENH